MKSNPKRAGSLYIGMYDEHGDLSAPVPGKNRNMENRAAENRGGRLNA